MLFSGTVRLRILLWSATLQGCTSLIILVLSLPLSRTVQPLHIGSLPQRIGSRLMWVAPFVRLKILGVFGVVFREEVDSYAGSFVYKISHLTCPNMVEILAVWEGPELVVQKNWQLVILESDAVRVVQLLATYLMVFLPLIYLLKISRPACEP